MLSIVFDHDGTLVDSSGEFKLYPGIKKLLAELRQRDISLYVWTARDRNSTVLSLKSLEIIGFFEDISTSTDCAPKPSADGLRWMLPDSATKVIMIGDSPGDIYGGKAIGACTIGVCWAHSGTNAKEVLDSVGADFVFETVEECREKLFQLIEEVKIEEE